MAELGKKLWEQQGSVVQCQGLLCATIDQGRDGNSLIQGKK